MPDHHSGSDDDILSDCEDDGAQLDRESLLSLNPFSLGNFTKAKQQYMAEFDVEKWVSELKELTAPTAFSMISWNEGVALQHVYQEACCGQKAKITKDDELALESLRRTLRVLMTEVATKCRSGGEMGYFVRLGPRSPKDAPMYTCAKWGLSDEKVGAAVKLAVSDLTFDKEFACDANAHILLQRFQTVCYRLLRATSEDDAISLLVSSSRVMQDVSRTMDHGRTSWNMSLVVRAWDDNFSLDREFRTFVVGGEITAIAQYDDQLCYSFVNDHPESIVKAILRSMENVKPKLSELGLTSPSMAVVIDFLVVPSSDDTSAWSAQVVELNPFGPVTGAPLFTWTTDRRLLQGGKDLYGDLEEVEQLHPAGSVPLPRFASEKVIDGIPFRYVVANPPKFTWEHLNAFFGDYMRLAFPAATCKQ